MSDDYPAHWAPRHAREQQARERQALAAQFSHTTSGCQALGSSLRSDPNAYPSDWTPKEGEIEE